MNRVDLVGRIVRDPEVRYTKGGKAVLGFTVAIDRKGKADGADFITCVAFGKTAENMGKYVSKGDRLSVVGRLQTGQYTDKNGVNHYTTDVITDEVEFLGGGKRKERVEPAEDDFDPEGLGFHETDIPF